MTGFLELNRHKIIFAFKVLSITFIILASIPLTIGLFSGELPDLLLLILILLSAVIGFPLLVITLGYLDWLSKQQSRLKAFSAQPFNQLDQLGFLESYLNDKTKWYFTEEIKEGLVMVML